MKRYIVLYRIESIMAPCDPPFGFECHADDTDHAEEQCENAYPEAGIVWVSDAATYAAALADYYETEV